MLRIGELARETGESVRTLRYWEGEGLLTAARSDSGYRLFPEAMIARVSFLREAQALGLGLREIRDLLALRDDGVQPCAHARDRLREHLADVRKRLHDLHALERELEERLTWAEANPNPECDDGCVYLTHRRGEALREDRLAEPTHCEAIDPASQDPERAPGGTH